jgi:arylsulfatase A-like enzyme
LDKVTVAEALRASGYATGMFGKWHLGHDAEHHPNKRGFDEAISSAGKHFNFATDPETPHDKDAYLADFLADRAVDFIARHKDQPFFLYLPHFAVHAPLEAKQELIAHFRDKPASGGHNDPIYAAMTASLDQAVGRVLKALDDNGLAENTLVVFSSDNGGVGGYQREGIQANDTTDNAPLRGGKGMLYDGGVHVPYIFRWKGKIAAGGTCQVPINSVDLYPTLLEVTGASKPQGYTLDGHSYASYLTAPNASAADREPIYWHFPGYLGSGNDTWRTKPAGAIRAGDWKLHEFFEDGRVELYNLADDPSERHDLAKEMPERAKQLQAQLAAWRKSVKAPMPKQNDDRLAPVKNRRERKKRNQEQAAANDD